MALHFAPSEFAARLARLQAEMQRQRFDAMFLFAQESMYWLTGYDSFGFCFFQCLVVRADGSLTLLTRSADLRQARQTSLIKDIRIWKDARDADPSADLKTLASELGLAGKRIGVEYETQGLTHRNGRRLESAFAGFAQLEEVSTLVPALRAVKSAAEIAYVRQAAELSDKADAAAIALLGAGAEEGDILGAMHDAIFRAGGDYPANEFIIGSGADALLCRYKSGRRKLDRNDQLTLEFAGVWRHYHAALMRTHIVGEPHKLHIPYHAAAREALLGCEAELRPGRSAGDVFAAHARMLDQHGLGAHRLNACGYSLGAKFTPSWMDPPMFYEANDFQLVPGMTMFLHMILMDSDSATAMCLGRTSLIGESASEPVNGKSLDLVIR
ncbi:Xaa-Pro dipeptidase [Rhizobiales bacterium GAS191]|nr:Xaa-Pro dipeptidase [Rhizobiales bacterium GAS191]